MRRGNSSLRLVLCLLVALCIIGPLHRLQTFFSVPDERIVDFEARGDPPLTILENDLVDPDIGVDAKFSSNQEASETLTSKSSKISSSNSSSSSSTATSVSSKHKQEGNGGNITSSQLFKLDNIVYFNSFANPERRRFMEDWIADEKRKSGSSWNVIRAEPFSDNKTGSVRWEAVVGGHGIGRSYPRLARLIPDLHDTSITLVLNDDATRVTNLSRLEAALSELPNKWNVARLDCDKFPMNRNVSWFRVSDTNSWTKHNHGSSASGSVILSRGIVFRGKSLGRVIEAMPADPEWRLTAVKWSRPTNSSKGKKGELKVFCINLGISQSNLVSQEPPIHPVEDAWFVGGGKRVSEEEILESLRKRNYTADEDVKIDRIIYHGMAKNTMRRKLMESWLSQQPIPFKRVTAQAGNRTGCWAGVQTEARCMGLSGLLFTLAGIIDNENMTGTTLLLEDDMGIIDKTLDRLELALKLVPNDWDIIRFDTWGLWPFLLDWPAEFVANTTKYTLQPWCKPEIILGYCEYPMCGGTYAMLFRETSLQKLKNMWLTTPYRDADCVIAGGGPFNVISYSINIGIFEHVVIQSEQSDISLFEDQTVGNAVNGTPPK